MHELVARKAAMQQLTLQKDAAPSEDHYVHSSHALEALDRVCTTGKSVVACVLAQLGLFWPVTG
jgi:hypothetical protein